MKTPLSIAVAALLAASLLPPAHAAEDGQLWEVSTKMEMADMPAGMPGGMGSRTMKMCRGEDPREAVTKDKEMGDCEIKDFKQTATTVSMTAVCKKGRTAKVEIVYNDARTEYKGTMRMKDGGDEMTMRMTGRKLGPCDAKKARAETDAMVAKHKAMGEDAQAQYKAMAEKAESEQISGCAKALETMNPDGFGFYGHCHGGAKDPSCKSLMTDSAKQQPKAAAECAAKIKAFCERYQTPDGFHKIGGQRSRLEIAGRMCGPDPDDLRAKLCKAASKSESLEFLGGNCPDLAKPLAKKHCAGRSYTVKEGDPRRVDKKWFKFCVAVAGSLAEASSDDEQPAPEKMKAKAKSEAQDAAKEAVKGAALDAFKGLFGK